MEFFDIFIFNNVKSNLKNHILPAQKSGFQDKSVIFVTSIPIPEAPMGRGWADIHMVNYFHIQLYYYIHSISDL